MMLMMMGRSKRRIRIASEERGKRLGKYRLAPAMTPYGKVHGYVLSYDELWKRLRQQSISRDDILILCFLSVSLQSGSVIIGRQPYSLRSPNSRRKSK